MLRHLPTLAFAAALAACAVPAPDAAPLPGAAPRAVAVSRDAIRVTMSDGRTCQGLRPAGSVGGWSGQLTACVYPFAYRVEMAETPSILAGAFEALLAAVGLDDDIGFTPEATVRITDALGRPHRFVSPDPALRD